jgi:hypothetical protein
MRTKFTLLALAAAAALCPAQAHQEIPAQPRLVLIDQDGSGPGGSNQMSILAAGAN